MSRDVSSLGELVLSVDADELAADVGVQLCVEGTQLLQQVLQVSLERVRLVE